MVFHWSLSKNKSPPVPRTLLSHLSNSEPSIVSTHPFISKSSSTFNSLLVTVPRAPITIGITVIFIFHNFFYSLARSLYLSFFSLTFNYALWLDGTAKSLLFLLLLLLLLIRVFHISVSWWSFIGDWVTASILKTPGLFSVFWPFSIMQLFRWSLIGRQLPNPPGPLIIL